MISLATAGMLAFSWPLWIEGGEIPRVPFLPGLPGPSIPLSWALFVLLLIVTMATGLSRRWRRWFALSFVLLAFAILKDQHRFQPWTFQYAVTVGLLALIPGKSGLRYVRWWFIALYVHSGLSKLDRSFCDELGPVFLDACLRLLNLSASSIPESIRSPVILAMPGAEILIAMALAFGRTRRLGRVGAVLLHGTLIAILGPLGLGHSTLVLCWNMAMMVEVQLVFGPQQPETPPMSGVRLRSIPGISILWALSLLPFGERSEWFDVWPSHALYASHVGRVVVFVKASELAGLPQKAIRHSRVRDADEVELDLTGWSREVRGTPIYPQVRACLGLAEGLGARYGVARISRVIVFGPAGRWTGRRSREEILGFDVLRRRADRFLLNAHPASAR